MSRRSDRHLDGEVRRMVKFNLLLAAGMIVGGGGVLLAGNASADDPAPTANKAHTSPLKGIHVDLAAIQQKAEACQATPDERKFDQIGWATTILAAQKLAKEHNRPVFLFTHDGRINTGRC